ncbi:MAG: DNA repair protein RecO [Armatimonadetes bacterium]|nr:DNA repair protein RecO [Armatimonadota bacterium]
MPRTAAFVPYPARALVLRARPLGEKDRVLTLFSPERGRFSAVAKGARGPKSKLAALAQPFILARFLLVKGRSLDIVSQAQIENAHGNLSGTVEKVAWASYGCEIADTLPEGLPDERGFEILVVFLGTLDSAEGDESVEAAGLWFEAQWLAHQGYAAVIGFCASCDEKISLPDDRPNAPIAFSPQQGGTLCATCAAMQPHTTVAASSLRALHRLERSRRAPASLFDAPFGLATREIGELGAVLRRCLSHHLEARLRSQSFLDEIRAAKRLGQSF